MNATPSWSWIPLKGFVPWTWLERFIGCDSPSVWTSRRESPPPPSSHTLQMLFWISSQQNMDGEKLCCCSHKVLPGVVSCSFSLGTSEAGSEVTEARTHLYPRHFASCRERMTRSVARPRPLAAGETAMILMSKSSDEFALENTSLLRAWELSSLHFPTFNLADHLGLQQDGSYWSKFWV